MRVAWAAPVGGDEGRRAGGAERRERLTGEIFSTETILSRARVAFDTVLGFDRDSLAPDAMGLGPHLPGGGGVSR